MLVQLVNGVKDVTSDETASQTVREVDLQWFCELEDMLYLVLLLRDAILPGA